MRKGFTLIELIVVIAIIAILAAIIAPNAFKAIEKSRISKAIADFRAVKTATLTLYTDTGKWPCSPDTIDNIYVSDNPNMPLFENTFNYQGWDGPYLEAVPGRNDWGGKMGFEYGTVNPQPGTSPTLEELWLEHEGGNVGSPYAVPDPAAIAIDRVLDDGDLTTGAIRRGGGDAMALIWVIAWDQF